MRQERSSNDGSPNGSIRPRPCENPANFCKQSRRAKFIAILSLPSGLRVRKSEQNRSVSKRAGVFTQARPVADLYGGSRQVSRKTRIQLSKAIFRIESSSKPLDRNAAIKFGRPLASLIAVGMVAPSKSDPIATRSIPIRSTKYRKWRVSRWSGVSALS